MRPSWLFDLIDSDCFHGNIFLTFVPAAECFISPFSPPFSPTSNQSGTEYFSSPLIWEVGDNVFFFVMTTRFKI